MSFSKPTGEGVTNKRISAEAWEYIAANGFAADPQFDPLVGNVTSWQRIARASAALAGSDESE